MLSTALSLAILTFTGFALVYSKLPRKIRKFLEKHALMTDLITLLAAYMFLGGTLTALFAASVLGILVSIFLHIVNNKDDYLFIVDAMDMVRNKIVELRTMLQNYGKEYFKNKNVVVEEST